MADISGLNFDANAVKPNEALSPIPPGDYQAVIIASEVKTTSKGDGKFIALTLQVMNGPHQNRKLYDNLNIWNPNEKAVQIAKGTLSAICRAVNVLSPKNTEELHGRGLTVTVGVKSDNDNNKSNFVKGYKPRSTGPSAPPPGSFAPQQPAAPVNTFAPPQVAAPAAPVVHTPLSVADVAANAPWNAA